MSILAQNAASRHLTRQLNCCRAKKTEEKMQKKVLSLGILRFHRRSGRKGVATPLQEMLLELGIWWRHVGREGHHLEARQLPDLWRRLLRGAWGRTRQLRRLDLLPQPQWDVDRRCPPKARRWSVLRRRKAVTLVVKAFVETSVSVHQAAFEHLPQAPAHQTGCSESESRGYSRSSKGLGHWTGVTLTRS